MFSVFVSAFFRSNQAHGPPLQLQVEESIHRTTCSWILREIARAEHCQYAFWLDSISSQLPRGDTTMTTNNIQDARRVVLGNNSRQGTTMNVAQSPSSPGGRYPRNPIRICLRVKQPVSKLSYVRSRQRPILQPTPKAHKQIKVIIRTFVITASVDLENSRHTHLGEALRIQDPSSSITTINLATARS